MGYRLHSSQRVAVLSLHGVSSCSAALCCVAIIGVLVSSSSGVSGLSCGASTETSTCFAAPATAGDRRSAARKSSGELVLAEFNAKMLFDGLGHGGVGDEGLTPDEAALHIGKIAEVVHSLDADIVHLVEAESCAVLRTLLAHSALANDRYRPYLIAGKDHELCQNVALLSRIDPLEDLTRADEKADYPVHGSSCPANKESSGTKSVTKNLIASFRANNHTIHLIGAHLLSQIGNNCDPREAQAEVLSGVAREILPRGSTNSEHLVIIGDFNEYDEAVPGASGQAPDSSTLSILRTQSLPANQKLTNLDSLVSPVDEQYTITYHKKDLLIDHILVSPQLAKLAVKVTIPKTFPLNNGKTNNHYSDHYPVVATFNLRKKVSH